MENGSFEVTSRFALLILFLCLCAVLVVPVSAATWYDDFSTNTSGSYEGDIESFTWDTANSRLSFNINDRQIYPGAFSYGRYTVHFSVVPHTENIIFPLIIGDQDNASSINLYTTGSRYVFDVNYDLDLLVLYRIVTGTATNIWSTAYTFNPTTEYNLTAVWAPGTISIYLNGALIDQTTDNTFTSGYAGLSTSWSWGGATIPGNFTLFQINETATSAFTCTPLIGTAPFSTTCTQTGDNHDDPGVTYQWSWDDGTANSTDEDPSHQYTAAGTYNVTLCVSNVAGTDCHTEAGYIDVGNAPPTSPPGMYAGTAGDEVNISGSIWLAALMIMGTIVVFVGRR